MRTPGGRPEDARRTPGGRPEDARRTPGGRLQDANRQLIKMNLISGKLFGLGSGIMVVFRKRKSRFFLRTFTFPGPNFDYFLKILTPIIVEIEVFS
jgi:hypothetical protein